VDVNKTNASIKSIYTGLSRMELGAAKAARGASAGIDGLTVSMVKGATAGNLQADGIKHLIEWVKEWTIEAAKSAASNDRMEAATRSLSRVHGEGAAAAMKAVKAIRQVGNSTDHAQGAVQKLIKADMGLSHAGGIAEVARTRRRSTRKASARPSRPRRSCWRSSLGANRLITKIIGITTAVEGLAAARTLNPIALLITGVLADGAVIRRLWRSSATTPPRLAPVCLTRYDLK
jgi:hypothetical protein